MTAMFKHSSFCPVVPPLAYPFRPMRGEIPFYLRDRLIFEAIEAHRYDLPLGVFMVQAWEQHRYPHIKMMRVLADAGITKQINGFWFWSVAAPAGRALARPEGVAKVDLNQPFSASVVVAPRISPMGWTAPQKTDFENPDFSV